MNYINLDLEACRCGPRCKVFILLEGHWLLLQVAFLLKVEDEVSILEVPELGFTFLLLSFKDLDELATSYLASKEEEEPTTAGTSTKDVVGVSIAALGTLAFSLLFILLIFLFAAILANDIPGLTNLFKTLNLASAYIIRSVVRTACISFSSKKTSQF